MKNIRTNTLEISDIVRLTLHKFAGNFRDYKNDSFKQVETDRYIETFLHLAYNDFKEINYWIDYYLEITGIR